MAAMFETKLKVCSCTMHSCIRLCRKVFLLQVPAVKDYINGRHINKKTTKMPSRVGYGLIVLPLFIS